ncbi:hypothetical protein H6F87_28845 [Cyanobacteria bacterium FACHB-502]|nr:hypothetical protein [Cyanobacteria bacterium FACHB-502]
MLDTIAKAPVQAAWSWLQSSLSGIADAPGVLMKGTQAIMSLLATGVLTLAAGWFIIFKAFDISIIITKEAIQITASAGSKSA